ncbi:putative cytochrome P450 [Rosellinia necatrix]|uniref:Putative cytochrome P450 n=1 Tax=Rosellinia necatrix TaxID=77044 RepID=A0A1W2TB13_ROSNE|nr:putative cytochrome P450 [Rosellinia necatrix]
MSWQVDPELTTQGVAGSGLLVYFLAGLVLIYIVAGDFPGLGSRYRKLREAPVVGAKFPFEPRWVTRYRFYSSGWDIIKKGCETVPSGLFTVVRPESNITIIPRKYVDELANLTDDRLASNEAIVNDMMGPYTGADILLKRYLGHHAVNTKLTPQLHMLVEHIEEELEITASEDPLDITEEWSEHRLSPYIYRLMARITSRLFLGVPICRDKRWLQLQLDLVMAIFHTILLMRNFPRFTHPLLGAVIPARKRLKKCMEELHDFLEPLIEERMAIDAKYNSRGQMTSDQYEKPNDVMQWMMDIATDEEYTADNLANRFVYTIMGSIRSVVEVVMNCMYELVERPEYIEPIREEMRQVLAEDGGWGKRSAGRMLKTDSFIKEISRHYPPSALAFRRITKEKIVLHDGLVLPKDTYICIATTSPAQDEVPNPYEFDGFRYYNERMAHKVGASRYDYAATDSTHIGFGHGRNACPGRFAASLESKMLLAHIILQFDIKLPPSRTTRPKSVKMMDFKIQDSQATIMMRKLKK